MLQVDVNFALLCLHSFSSTSQYVIEAIICKRTDENSQICNKTTDKVAGKGKFV